MLSPRSLRLHDRRSIEKNGLAISEIYNLLMASFKTVDNRFIVKLVKEFRNEHGITLKTIKGGRYRIKIPWSVQNETRYRMLLAELTRMHPACSYYVECLKHANTGERVVNWS